MLDKFIPNKLSGYIVADLGCQNTQFMLDLLTHFPEIERVIGIDDDRDNNISSFFNITHASQLSTDYKRIIQNSWLDNKEANTDKIEFKNQSIEEYLRPCKSHDLICLKNVLHSYSDKQERQKLLKMIYESISPKGHFLIRVANTDHTYKDDDNKTVFSAKSIREELNEQGFEIISPITQNNTNLFCLSTLITNKE